MTHKNAVCPNLKWTCLLDEWTPVRGGYIQECIYICEYKGYKFQYHSRTYNEYATEEEPAYSEWNDSCYCITTWETIWEDEGHYDFHIIDYVEEELSKCKVTRLRKALRMKLCILHNTVLAYLYEHWIVSRKWRMKYVLDCNTWERCNSKEYLKEYWWD